MRARIQGNKSSTGQLCVETVYRLRAGTPEVKVAGVFGVRMV
jgi:hypothetical protein